ncbi:hypothetical protein X824_gp197 [Escherichia phage 4MG]|uniref:Hyphothetical protein n=1 Tax=Escherichia phage 4MG TaxID=1391428 RepID=V5KSP4_9CAUD|nr:hypothetical protein X824_gp197 [Escherichia phage 4MG]AGZ17626.1 hyphothetical protein [Escherichia phage 4MG]
MTNKTYTVVKDQCHENMGTPSTVGQSVTTIVAVPSGTQIVIVDQNGAKGFSRVRRDVYLTLGGTSRIADRFGNVSDCTFSVYIGGVAYNGNDVYTAEELGITE